MPKQKWQELALAKRHALNTLIPEEWRIGQPPTATECPNVIALCRQALTSEEIEITELEPMSLLANIHAQIWTSEEVVRAFCHRAAVSHQLSNCLSEIMFSDAIATAQSLDQHYQQHGILHGPLHGLPMSFMDRYRIADYETSSGFVAWLGTKESRQTEGLIVRHMRRLGAVPFCKTNCPQSMLLAATDNNVTGPTLSPYNRALSAGGAAGGEGALQAMRGSPFGWATEIAGSARIPAAFNDLFALRVSQGRLSNTGIASTSKGKGLAEYAVTPALISWSLPMIQHIARLTVGSKPYQDDPHWLDLPWRETRYMSIERTRRRLAIMYHDQYVPPQPPVQRALNLVFASLSSQGYDVVEWHPPPHAAAIDTYFRLLGADGGLSIRNALDKAGEPPVKGLQAWYSEPVTSGKLTADQLWSWCDQKSDYRALYCKYWREMNVEGVIMPVLANAAAYEHGLSYFGYSAIVNYLDFTAVSFPVTMVDKSIDSERFELPATTSSEATKARSEYDVHAFHGCPVGLQIMCRRLEEEMCLKLAETITRSLNQYTQQRFGVANAQSMDMNSSIVSS